MQRNYLKNKSKGDNKSDYLESNFREKLLEHVFVSEILQEAWINRNKTIEVLRSEVDSSGYDLVLECNGVIRHVQLKSSRKDSNTSRQNINVNLAKKPSGCVIWMVFEEDEEKHKFKINYRFFGNGPNEQLPLLDKFSVGKHTKANSEGNKSIRPSIRVIPKGQFIQVNGIEGLMDRLFGSDKISYRK